MLRGNIVMLFPGLPKGVFPEMGLRRKIFNFLRNAFALIGVLTIVIGAFGFKLVLNQYQLTPNQFAVKLAQKAGIESPLVIDLLSPTPKHADYAFTGTLHKQRRPRILFDGKATLQKIRDRYRQDVDYAKSVNALSKSSSYLLRSIAWACGKDEKSASYAIRAMQDIKVASVAAEGNYGNGLDIALAYDLLSNYPEWSVEDRQRIDLKLRQFLQDALTVLDGDSASLWHGRTQLASSAWVAAAALDIDETKDLPLIARAQAHFLESVEAITLTEGWPEGYNYWINNRAFPFVVASLAHLNAVDAPDINQKIRAVLERVGLWTIYGTEPQGRFHLFGDTGPRNDLKDETQRVIDLIYLATNKPIFKKYSEYLTGLHGREAYYSGYRWGIPLFRGLVNEEEGSADLGFLKGRFSTADIFGRDNFGQAFIRSGWDSNATFISFQAGDTFTHHGHYQAGHFTINKAGEPLAITSGTYGGWTVPHRINYYLRTVAANSLLVLRPEEQVKPNRFFKTNVADGGQRIIMPTGSAVLSVDDWRKNIDAGRHYEGGSILAFEHRPQQYDYVSSDLTAAYNNSQYDETGRGGKVKKVIRDLVYLPSQDLVLIHDRLSLTDASYTPKWLLHTNFKPVSTSESVLVGNVGNGILETRDDTLWVEGQKSRLTIQRLLPKNAIIRKVGGPDYRYYVETDGDDSQLDGLNMDVGAKEQPWFDAGLWRLEIQPPTKQKEVSFLVVMAPRVRAVADTPKAILIQGVGVEGVIVGNKTVLFVTEGGQGPTASYRFKAKGDSEYSLFGVSKNKQFKIVDGSEEFLVMSSVEGVLNFVTANKADTAQDITVQLIN